MKHSPEPWMPEWNGHMHWIKSANEKLIADTGFSSCAEGVEGKALGDANAQRIVSCVNACAGVPDGLLHGGAYREMIQAQTELTIQRDELLSALQKYEEAFDWLFGKACSNGLFNAWGALIDCSLLNEAHELAGKAINQCAAKAAKDGS